MVDLILVDEKDNEIGKMEKIKAHENGGKLHRAFSILVFNDERELLIQQRALSKYHWPGIWANTCCSHPMPGEKTLEAAHRRLMEEMGFDTDLKEEFTFIYKANYDNGLTEHELDHVISGKYNENPKVNPEEVNDFKWITIPDLIKDIEQNPQNYAPWFKIIIKKARDKKLI